jgi:Raf kinase inhibitor-like YbhB/YbcL family protein
MSMRLVLAALLAALAALPADAMVLKSSDLIEGALMPPALLYPRCGGRNISPELSWADPPPATRSFVVTMVDVDVKPSGWSHWIVVGLEPGSRSLAEGLAQLPDGAKAITSNFGDAAYAGPCPPAGTGVHHYRITVWAMPTSQAEVAPDASASVLENTLARTSLAHASLMTTARG